MALTQLRYNDFTIKARLNNPKQVEQALHSLLAQFVGADLQIDYYFNTPHGKLKWRQGLIENLITHYERIQESGVERTIVYRYDLNPLQDQIEELKRNHTLIGITKKERRIYKLNNVKIHLDKLPSNEEFVEIEAIDREGRFDLDELRIHCLELKQKLGISDSDLVPTGYLKK